MHTPSPQPDPSRDCESRTTAATPSSPLPKAKFPTVKDTAILEFTRNLIEWGVVPRELCGPATSFSELPHDVATQVHTVYGAIPSARVVRHLFFSAQLCAENDGEAFKQMSECALLMRDAKIAKPYSKLLTKVFKITPESDSLEAAITARNQEALKESYETRKKISPTYRLEHEILFQLTTLMRTDYDGLSAGPVLFGLAAAMDQAPRFQSDRKFIALFIASGFGRRGLFYGGSSRAFDIFWTWLEPTPWAIRERPFSELGSTEPLVAEIIRATQLHGEPPRELQHLAETSLMLLCSLCSEPVTIGFIQELFTHARKFRQGLASEHLLFAWAVNILDANGSVSGQLFERMAKKQHEPGWKPKQFSKEGIKERFLAVLAAIKKCGLPPLDVLVKHRDDVSGLNLYLAGIDHFRATWGSLALESPSLDQLVDNPKRLAEKNQYDSAFTLMISYTNFGVDTDEQLDMLAAYQFHQAIKAGQTQATPAILQAIDRRIGPVFNALHSDEKGMILNGSTELISALQILFFLGAKYPGREDTVFGCVANCLRLVEGLQQSYCQASTPSRLTHARGRIPEKLKIIDRYFAEYGPAFLPITWRYFWIAHGGDLVDPKLAKQKALVPGVAPNEPAIMHGRLFGQYAIESERDLAKGAPGIGFLLDRAERLLRLPSSFSRLQQFGVANLESWLQVLADEARNGSQLGVSQAQYRSKASDQQGALFKPTLRTWTLLHRISSDRSFLGDLRLKIAIGHTHIRSAVADSCISKPKLKEWWHKRRAALFRNTAGEISLEKFEDDQFRTLTPLTHELAFHAMGCFEPRYGSPPLSNLQGRGFSLGNEKTDEHIGLNRTIVDRLYLLSQVPNQSNLGSAVPGEIPFDSNLLKLFATPRVLRLKAAPISDRLKDPRVEEALTRLGRLVAMVYSHTPDRIDAVLKHSIERRLGISLQASGSDTTTPLFEAILNNHLALKRQRDTDLICAAFLNRLGSRELPEHITVLNDKSASTEMRARIALEVIAAVVDHWSGRKPFATRSSQFALLIQESFQPEIFENGLDRAEDSAAADARYDIRIFTALTRGIPLRFMGFISDTCAVRLINPGDDRPNLAFMPFFEPDAPSDEPCFLGGTGLLAALAKDGRRCLIIRSFNPRESLLKLVPPHAFVGRVIDEIQNLMRIKDASGKPFFDLLAMPDEHMAGVTLSNSPALVRAFQRYAAAAAHGTVELLNPDSITFNHHEIRDPLRILRIA